MYSAIFVETLVARRLRLFSVEFTFRSGVSALIALTALLASTSCYAQPAIGNAERQVVEGSLIGFALPNAHQPLPQIFTAPDGKPDLIFLPKIKGKQDADPKLVNGKQQIFETFFGAKRFKATLLSDKVDGNFRITGLRLPGQGALKLDGPLAKSYALQNDERIVVSWSGIVGPTLETFNNTCDAPGGWSFRFEWKESGKVLLKQFVVRVPWREYPCQGLREEPSAGSYWRQFTGDTARDLILPLGDLREGVFVNIAPVTNFPKNAGIKLTPFSYPRYVVYLDSRKDYAAVEMLRADLMLLDNSVFSEFREQVQNNFNIAEIKKDQCINSIYKKQNLVKKSDYLKSTISCRNSANPAMVSENEFVSTFVPGQWRKLWRR